MSKRAEELLAQMREEWQTAVRNPPKSYLMEGLDEKIRTLMKRDDAKAYGILESNPMLSAMEERRSTGNFDMLMFPREPREPQKLYWSKEDDGSNHIAPPSAAELAAERLEKWKGFVPEEPSLFGLKDYDAAKRAHAGQREADMRALEEQAVFGEGTLFVNQRTYDDLMADGDSMDATSMMTMLDGLMDKAAQNMMLFGNETTRSRVSREAGMPILEGETFLEYAKRMAPMIQAREAARLAVHKATIADMPDSVLAALQEEHASRKVEPLPCDDCDEYSMGELEMVTDLVPCTTVEAIIGANGLRQHADSYSYWRPCEACEAKEPEDRSWIRSIPLAAFRKFQEEHPSAYCLDDLKPLAVAEALCTGDFKPFEGKPGREYNFKTEELQPNANQELKFVESPVIKPGTIHFLQTPYRSTIITGIKTPPESKCWHCGKVLAECDGRQCGKSGGFEFL